MNSKILLLIIMAGIILALVSRYESSNDKPKYVQTETDPHRADHIISELRVVVMNETGTPYYRLHAEEMRHYSDDDTADMVSPEIYFYRDDAPPIDARSPTGWIAADGAEIHLLGDVRIHQPPDQTHRAVTLDTRDLQVLPQRKTAHTDQQVTTVDNIHTLTGIGLDVDFNSGLMNILSQTRAVYAP